MIDQAYINIGEAGFLAAAVLAHIIFVTFFKPDQLLGYSINPFEVTTVR